MQRVRDPTRKLGHVVVEIVVSFLFLLTNRLARVVNRKDTDMLTNLEHACNSFAQAGKTKELPKTTATSQANGDAEQQEDAQSEQQEREKVATNTSRCTARGDTPDPDFSSKHPYRESDASSSQLSASRKYPHYHLLYTATNTLIPGLTKRASLIVSLQSPLIHPILSFSTLTLSRTKYYVSKPTSQPT